MQRKKETFRQAGYTILTLVAVLASFFLARWLLQLFTTPVRADIQVHPDVLVLSDTTAARLSVQLYNQLGLPLDQHPQLMLEIAEGFDSIVIDTVYPGGAILRAGTQPGVATLRIWIEGFAFPYEVTIRVLPFPTGIGYNPIFQFPFHRTPPTDTMRIITEQCIARSQNRVFLPAARQKG